MLLLQTERGIELNPEQFRMQMNHQNITMGKDITVGRSAGMHLCVFLSSSLHKLPTLTLRFTYILKHLISERTGSSLLHLVGETILLFHSFMEL